MSLPHDAQPTSQHPAPGRRAKAGRSGGSYQPSHLQALWDAGLITRRAGKLALTTAGEVVLDLHLQAFRAERARMLASRQEDVPS